MPPARPPGSFGSSGVKAARAPSASAVAFAAPPRGGGGFRGGGSFHGDGSFLGGGLRGGNFSRFGGCVSAGRQEFCAIDRAGLRNAEPLVCEPALAQGSPGFGLLSERHGEGTAAQGLELSSQATGLFQVCHGYGFGGCHCCLGRRRLAALLNGLGVFADEGPSLVYTPHLLSGAAPFLRTCRLG
jgi:hypothetical protein